MIKVSVIVPVFNTASYLKRCLDSLLAQTLKEIEIICVNDGSTDNSLDILHEYQEKDTRIKVLSQTNQGQSVARNNGITEATGEYIGFIDSDDYIDPDYYEVLYHCATQHHADIAVAKTKILDNRLTPLEFASNDISYNFCDSVQRLSNGSACDKIFKRSLCNTHQLQFPQHLYFEDNVFLIKALFFSKITVFTDKVTYYYIPNSNGISKNTDPAKVRKRRRDAKAIKNILLKFACNYAFSKDERTHLKSFILRSLPPRGKTILDFFYQRKRTKSDKIIIKICKIPVYHKKAKIYIS